MRTKTTNELLQRLRVNTSKIGTFSCPEVTIFRNGADERVDYLTYDKRKGIWRFYEIKSCKADFYSDAKWTFLGQYNYFVMSSELYKEVKHDIPDYVGVTNGYRSIKRAKRQELQIDSDKLGWLMFRSLHTQYKSALETVDNLKWNIECLKDNVAHS